MFTELFTESKLKLDDVLKDDTPKFADAMYMYLMYNDKDSIKDLLDIKNISKLFTKQKRVYRIFRGASETDYVMNEFGITSTSTKQDTMIDEFKDMIQQYNKNGYFYQNTIEQGQGININKLYNSLKGDIKRLKSKYDKPGNQPIGALVDALKDLKDQKEFLIFGNYKVVKTTEI